MVVCEFLLEDLLVFVIDTQDPSLLVDELAMVFDGGSGKGVTGGSIFANARVLSTKYIMQVVMKFKISWNFFVSHQPYHFL